MPESIGVVVAHDDALVTERIVEALEGAPDLYVAATSLAAARDGHVVVAGGEALVTIRSVDRPLVAVAGSDPLRAARAALAAGARDIVRWPDERERLPGAIRRAAGARTAPAAGRAVAVLGARGGAGCTTVAAVLAASLGDAIVVDLDAAGAGQRAFAPEEPARTLADVRAPADVAPDALAAALAPHAGGARALHASPRGPALGVPEVHGVLAAARALAAAVVLDCGRGEGSGALAAAAAADARIVVAVNDVASVRGVRALAGDLGGGWLLVVRRARRGGVALRDLAAAVGAQPAAVIPNDRALARAADLGALPGRASRGVRALRGLARTIEETPR